MLDITPSMTQKKKDEGFNTKTNKKNKTSNKTGQLNYQTKNINDEHSVYICSCLGGVGD